MLKVIKRDGRLVDFDISKVKIAVEKAFSAAGVHQADSVVGNVVDAVFDQIQRFPNADPSSEYELISIESIQDIVVNTLRSKRPYVADIYQSYREKRQVGRELNSVESREGVLITPEMVADIFIDAGVSKEDAWEWTGILFTRHLHDGISKHDLVQVALLSVLEQRIYRPEVDSIAASLLLSSIKTVHTTFSSYIVAGVQSGRLLPEMSTKFDLSKLENALKPLPWLKYNGLKILVDRYLLQDMDGCFLETPSWLFMRVAMGLSISENNPTEWAIAFYTIMANAWYMPSTPTLFNSGTVRPQLSSCYVTLIPDSLDGIYHKISEQAALQKFAGGVGLSATPIRGVGAVIKGTNGLSQGVVPFLKVMNDTAVAVNQGGKRRGAVCAYLETWHIDIEEFLELRKNTGDERRRTHDMNTANWIPDLFMRRVEDEQEWTLFSPDDVPDLHSLYGSEFEKAYCKYEKLAQKGKIPHKKVDAQSLYRRMLTMLYETGHPWILFKDGFNRGNPNAHVGPIHSSNLCTEIAIPTTVDMTAVCNLGSINLGEMISDDGYIAIDRMRDTVKIAVRMLDNVITNGWYPSPESDVGAKSIRPIGLGAMGFWDAVYKTDTPVDKLAEFAGQLQEQISFFAISYSCDLADERGSYPEFNGSTWSRGIVFPSSEGRLNWESLRERCRKGIRNGNVLAIAPTATISNICGVSSSYEPFMEQITVKQSLSGNLTYHNQYLVDDLKKEGLWSRNIVDRIIGNGGMLGGLALPISIIDKYFTVWEMSPNILIDIAAEVQKWVDQSVSRNLYLGDGVKGRDLWHLYMYAWKRGLKATYYLRTVAATQVEQHSFQCSTDTECEVCQ